MYYVLYSGAASSMFSKQQASYSQSAAALRDRSPMTGSTALIAISKAAVPLAGKSAELLLLVLLSYR